MSEKIKINGMDIKLLPTQPRLLEVFSYNPDTGVLSRGGRVAGSLHKARGYRYVRLDGAVYLAHRIIWKMVTGEEPTFIDHIDLDGCNNRWVNIRSCDRAGNQRNHGIRSDNSSGHKGIHWDAKRSRWIVQVQSLDKRFHGQTRTLAGAIALHRLNLTKMHGEFARTS